MNFLLIKPVFSSYLYCVTLFQSSLERSHKTGLPVSEQGNLKLKPKVKYHTSRGILPNGRNTTNIYIKSSACTRRVSGKIFIRYAPS